MKIKDEVLDLIAIHCEAFIAAVCTWTVILTFVYVAMHGAAVISAWSKANGE